jgi:hypothetical protein
MPAQICNRELLSNLLGLFASAADQGKRDTALALVSSPAAMSTIRLTIALSAFLVHIAAHVRLPVKPPYTNTEFHLRVYRRLLTIARVKNVLFQ